MNLYETASISKVGSQFKVHRNNKLIQKYRERDIGSAKFDTVLQRMSLYQLVLKWRINGKFGNFEPRPPSNKHVVIDWTPKLFCTPNDHAKFIDFLKLELIKYRPWRGSKEQAYIGARQLVVEETLQNLIKAHVDKKPLSNVHDVADLEDEQPSDSISVAQMFAFYSRFMNGDWAQASSPCGRPNVPEIVRLQVKHCRIKLEPDELKEAGSVEAEPDIFGQFDGDLDDIDDIVIPDHNLTHNWHLDAQQHAQYVGTMDSQVKELRTAHHTRDIHLRVTGDLHPDQQLALDIITRHHQNENSEQLLMGIFGEPGTGKSICINRAHYLLQHLARTLGPTGKVAYLNSGATIQSFLVIGRDAVPHMGIKERKGSLERLQSNLDGVQYIIVDEVSMVGHRLFSWMELHLRIGTGKEDIPFGGMNVIIVGDFAQLPPIGDASLFREPYVDKGKLRGYLPGHLLYKVHFQTIVLLSPQYNQRQIGSGRDKLKFKRFLNRVRNGKLSFAADANEYESLVRRASNFFSSVEDLCQDCSRCSLECGRSAKAKATNHSN